MRLRLCNLLTLLRSSETFSQLPKRDDELLLDREFKNSAFHQIYSVILELLKSGRYYARFERRYDNLVIASIDPPADEGSLNDFKKESWHVEFEDSLALYLDVCGQLMDQFSDDEKRCRTCFDGFTIRSADFDGSKLILSKPKSSCEETKNIIYGIRCRICPPCKAYQIRYVGKTYRTAHTRVCTNYNSKVAPLVFSHLAGHSTSTTLRKTMELIYLPPKNLCYEKNYFRSWECFWQFFCRSRQRRGGWSKK